MMSQQRREESGTKETMAGIFSILLVTESVSSFDVPHRYRSFSYLFKRLSSTLLSKVEAESSLLPASLRQTASIEGNPIWLFVTTNIHDEHDECLV
jgi:hypothetical protein